MRSLLWILLTAALCAAAFAAGRMSAPPAATAPISAAVTVTDTVYVRDTVTETAERWRTAVRTETIAQGTDTVYVEVERAQYVRRIDSDSVSGEIRATVSGWGVRLDTLSYDLRLARQTVYVERRRRWGWTAGATVGAGWNGRGFSPYAGVGITYGFNF